MVPTNIGTIMKWSDYADHWENLLKEAKDNDKAPLVEELCRDVFYRISEAQGEKVKQIKKFRIQLLGMESRINRNFRSFDELRETHAYLDQERTELNATISRLNKRICDLEKCKSGEETRLRRHRNARDEAEDVAAGSFVLTAFYVFAGVAVTLLTGGLAPVLCTAAGAVGGGSATIVSLSEMEDHEQDANRSINQIEKYLDQLKRARQKYSIVSEDLERIRLQIEGKETLKCELEESQKELDLKFNTFSENEFRFGRIIKECCALKVLCNESDRIQTVAFKFLGMIRGLDTLMLVSAVSLQ